MWKSGRLVWKKWEIGVKKEGDWCGKVGDWCGKRGGLVWKKLEISVEKWEIGVKKKNETIHVMKKLVCNIANSRFVSEDDLSVALWLFIPIINHLVQSIKQDYILFNIYVTKID